jgi:hypothetical protein
MTGPRSDRVNRLPQSNAASVSGPFRVVTADWATLPDSPGSANSVASVDRSRNTDIGCEADELAAAVADLSEELARA